MLMTEHGLTSFANQGERQCDFESWVLSSPDSGSLFDNNVDPDHSTALATNTTLTTTTLDDVRAVTLYFTIR